MANPNVQKVPKLMLQFNDWQAAGKIDKQQNNQMNSLVLSYHPEILALADEIGKTPDADLLAKALAVTASAAEASAASKGAGAGSGSGAGSGASGRKGRPALNIGTVKNANATPEAAHADEQESQADALLKAKRMRNLKRQSLPEKLPASVQDQIPQ